MADGPKHVISAAAVVLNPGGRVLLIKGPRRGWEMPGGQVEEGESIRDAACREVFEESGIIIDDVRFCGIFQNLSRGICNTLWRARAVGGTPTCSEESLAVGFFTVEEALARVTWKNFSERIGLCLDESRHPFFVEF